MLTIEKVRDYYALDDPVHGFPHILRVYRLSKKIAEAEGADQEIVRAAAFLHDIQGDVHQREGHHLAAADAAAQILQQENWTGERIEAVTHCIRSHRFRDQQESPQTLEAKVLFDADKIDAIGAVGTARAFAYAVRAGQTIYQLPSPHFLKTGEKEHQESHSPYHEYLIKLRYIKERLFTPTGKAMAESRHQVMVEFFQQWAIELQDAI